MKQALELATEVFKAVDSMSGNALRRFLTDDASFCFGNGIVADRENILAAVKGYIISIAGIKHEILNAWQVGDDVVIVGLMVEYIFAMISELCVFHVPTFGELRMV